jgi:hypothetical protein
MVATYAMAGRREWTIYLCGGPTATRSNNTWLLKRTKTRARSGNDKRQKRLNAATPKSEISPKKKKKKRRSASAHR